MILQAQGVGVEGGGTWRMFADRRSESRKFGVDLKEEFLNCFSEASGRSRGSLDMI